MNRKKYLPIHLEKYDWLSHLDHWKMDGGDFMRHWTVQSDEGRGIICCLFWMIREDGVKHIVGKGAVTVEECVYLALEKFSKIG